ncbi:MAG: hypothetical protein KF857_12165 [Fimbriimonadaceae bacterium]|nr:hypothetical protein [Fimbriimonadaceae bacterium]
MSRVTLSAVALALLALTGCQGNKELTPNPEPPKPSSNATNSTDPPKPANLPPVTGPVTNPDVFKVKPGKDLGYSPSKMGFADLGAKTDAGIQQLKNGKGVVVMEYESPKGKSHGNIDIFVRDKSTYKVEYLLPKTEGTPNRLAGDGKRNMVYEGYVWTKPTPRKTSGPMSRADVDAWIARFPAEIMSGLQDGAPVWRRLLDALSSDPGRTTTMEEQEVTVSKVKRPIFRIVSRKKGVEGDSLEIVIDGHRWLPLTVKASFHDENKAPVHMFWTTNWMFGGTFPDSDFVIPVK